VDRHETLLGVGLEFIGGHCRRRRIDDCHGTTPCAGCGATHRKIGSPAPAVAVWPESTTFVGSRQDG
jgi:hypothetical protein